MCVLGERRVGEDGEPVSWSSRGVADGRWAWAGAASCTSGPQGTRMTAQTPAGVKSITPTNWPAADLTAWENLNALV